MQSSQYIQQFKNVALNTVKSAQTETQKICLRHIPVKQVLALSLSVAGT